MILTLLRYEFYIPEAHSLKEKRRIIKGLKEGIKANFNVSAAEVNHLDKWQMSEIAIALITNSKQSADSTVDKIDGYIYKKHSLQIANFERTEY